MQNNPFVSIIMPIRNEAGFIERSLGAVLAQNYPANCMEVLVADGMSTDTTREIIERLRLQHTSISIQVLDNPALIVPAGINRALQVARGDVIVRVDGHTEIAPDYVQQCVAALNSSGADNVGGKMTAVGKTPFGRTVALATSTPFGVGGARFHYSNQQEWVDTVYLGAWRRDVFERIGLFDEEFVRNQDDEFNYRLREHGGRILLSPHIKSIYTGRNSPSALWRQYFQYGFWKVRVLQKHPRQMQPRQFAPPLLVAVLLVSALLALFFRLGRWLLVLAVGIYAIANLAISLWLAANRGWPHMMRLPLVFVILHLGYGSGFLAGLIRFADRWGRRSKHPATGKGADHNAK